MDDRNRNFHTEPLRIALIPAYEPGPLLLDLLAQAVDAGLQPIIIDDGSGPAYADIFINADRFAAILTHTENRGKGAALKSGLTYIKEHYKMPYTIVTIDADGQHRITDAVRMCEHAERKPDTLILGSRGLQENVPLRSRFGNTVTRFVYMISTGKRVHDTQTGLRSFSGALLPALLDIPGERYEYEMNVLLESAHHGIPIEEIGISTIYFDNNSGTHFNTLKDSYRIYKEILKYSASSFICFLLDYTLYSLFSILSAFLGALGLTVSNVCARIVSASVNYIINRKFVFKDKKGIRKSAFQYFALAMVILLGNTLVLKALAGLPGMNQYTAKLLTELLFFLLSWLIQRFVIFHNKQEAPSKVHGCLTPKQGMSRRK